MPSALLSISLLSLLCLVSPWCYKTYFTLLGDASTIDVSPDSAYIAITSRTQGLAYVYDTANFNLLLKYPTPSGTARTARFSSDGLYLGVGGSDGNIYLLSGRPPFSSTTVLTTLTTGSTKYQIADIDFNSGNTKIVSCYTNGSFYNIYSSYNGTASATPQTISNSAVKCVFGFNDDVALIDTNNRARTYSSGGTSGMSVNSGSNNFKDIDVKPATAAPYKVIVCGGNNNAYIPTSTTTSLPSSILSLGAALGAACYSPDGLVYAFGGGSSSERRVFMMDGTSDNLVETFNDSSLNLISCSFTKNGEYLLMGSTASGTGQASVFVYKKNCFDCPLGTYLTGNSTCTSCTATLFNCATCINSSKCQDCFPGYFVNPTTNVCSKCDYAMEGCSVCVGMVTCVECNSNYYLNSSSLCSLCHATMPGCIACNSSSNCLICASSHYLNSNACSRCSFAYSNCIRCNSSQCLQCAAGFYLNGASCSICSTNCSACQNTANNCSGCTRGLYLSGNACVNCLTNCLQCNSTAFCLDCRTGSYLTATGTCVECLPGCATCNSSTYCMICLPGYYINSGVCQPCISNCSSCSSATNCSSCPLAYYLSSSFTCLSCHFLLPNCSSCNLTRCFSCELGYYLNTSFLCTSCATANCLVCNSSSTCQLCNNGYFLTASATCSLCTVGCDTCQLTTSNCTACVVGYYLSSTSCVACGPTCTSCNSSLCFSCSLGYFLSAGVCQSCWGQLNGCVECANNSVCLNCGVGRYLWSGSCVDCAGGCLTCNATMCLSCDVGYFSPSGNCSKCMDGCSECSALTNCFACNVGYFYNSTKTSSQCSSCSLLSRGCTTCNSTFCFDCSPGFKLDSTSHLCLPCANLPNCQVCDTTGCQLCSYGHYLVAPNCLACSLVLPGCESCSSNAVCVGCGVGYFLSGSNCVACAARCGSCNSTACLSCALSYVWNATLGDCVFCDSYLSDCELCANTTSCLRCSSGAYLMSGTCSPCQVALAGCAYCNTSAACSRCLEGYYLAPAGCQLCPATEGCRLCSSASNCTACNSGYVLSSTACVLCSSLLPACLSCNSSTQCALCQSGYYLNGLVCSSCSSPIPGCTLCSSSSVCTACEGGYFLNSSTGCSACQSVGCQTCTSGAANGCVGCQAGYLLSSGSCVGCGVQGCLVCSGVGTCLVCSDGYYLLGNGTCGLCSMAMVGCGRCSSVGVCVECMTLYYLSGSSCAACSVSLPGCSFCSNSSYCLSCDSGFYLNSTSLCSLCSTLTGCLLCSNSSSCLYCKSGYYNINGSCTGCSAIGNCTTCYNGSLCTACLSGYMLTAAGGCEAIKVASGAAAVEDVKEVKFKSEYVDKDRLKHTLQVREGKFKQAKVDWTTQAKIYLQNKSKSILLTIINGEWNSDGKTLYLTTNNPIALASKSIPFARLLIDSSLSTDLKTSLSLSQTALAAILPSLLHQGDLSVAYALTEPEFYISYLLVESPSKYFLVGVVLTVLLGLNFLIRAMCTVTVAQDHGEILGHVFAMKAVAIGLYPMFGEYVDWGFGFMTADLPWAAGRIGAFLGDSSDVAAPGYLLFFTNMSLFSTFTLPLLILLILLLLIYLVLGRSAPSSYSLRNEADERLARASNKYLAVRQFVFSFFQMGLVFAGCASLQGAILNPSSMLSVNGVGYILGMMVWVGLLGETIYQCYSEWRVSRARIFIKGSLLSAVHFNPIYIVSVVLVVDLLALLLEAKLRWDSMVAPKWWVLSNLLPNIALAILFFLPDSLLTIVASSSLLSLLVLFQFYIHCLQKRIRPTQYPLFDKTTVLPSKKINPDQTREEVTWKLNLDDYSLEKCVTKETVNDKQATFPDIQDIHDDMQETKYATTKYSQPKDGGAVGRDRRRNRRFNASRAESTQSWKQLETTFHIDQK